MLHKHSRCVHHRCYISYEFRDNSCSSICFQSKLQILCFAAIVETCRLPRSYPGDDGEEREGDGGAGGVGALVEWHLFRCGPRPLIGQEAEADKVKKSPET